MSSGEASTSSHPSKLTLGQMMTAVGILAVSFAFLPWVLSGVLAITVFGIVLLQGLRVPVVTERGGLWCWLPWVVWCLSLAACPVAIFALGIEYQHTGPYPDTNAPRPWAALVVGVLYDVHLGLSVVASMAVVVLVREGSRWLAWGAIVVLGFFAAFVALCGVMSITGEAL